MFFTYKPTKFRTHGRLPQSPRVKVRVPRKKLKYSSTSPSLVRA